MNINHWKKIESIYDQAIGLKPQDQLNFVEKLAAGDQQLISQMMKMLAAKNVGFMETYPGKFSEDNWDLTQPKTLGNFKIIKKIATGGMGRVYLAQSISADVPIQVALKTIRVELINQDLKNKFQNEKQVLSKLQHKNIARLIDAGITEQNIPYIATQWIEGPNIKQYCITQKPSLKERLRLFLQICDAVAFAHNNLIIHRDLKPDNVLVDKHHQAMLLDFGIAKIIDDNQNQQTQTQIYTPDYAAPEQINGEPCTVATDIYSLGVVLYELLTNTKYFDLSTLSAAQKIKAINSPKNIELNKLTLDQSLPYSLTKIKGPLENIINKAMHVESNRRYGSVATLVSDIKNYLASRPVTAMKDSYGYKLKMLVKRNKLSSFFIFLASASAILGSALTIKQLNEKLIEVQKSQQITDFLIDSIQASDPDVTKGENLSVIEFLQNAKIRIQESDFNDNKLSSDLKSTIAIALTKVGAYKEAENLLIQSINDDVNNAKAHIALAHLYLEQKSFELANKELIYLQKNQKSLSPREQIQRQQLAAKVLLNQGKFESAIQTIQTVLSKQNQQNLPQLIESKLIFATILDEYDHVDDSTKILRETLELSQTAYGIDSTQTTQILEQLARNLSNSSPVPWPEVFELYQRSLKNQILIYGENHPIVAKSLLNEGFAYKFFGDLEKASNNATRARDIALSNFDENHILVAHIDLLRSQLSFLDGKLDTAISHLEKVLNTYTRQYGENHFTTNQAKTTLNAYLIKAERGEEALANLLVMYQSQKEQLGEHHKAVFYVKLHIIKAYNLLKMYDQAVNEGLIAWTNAKQHIGAESILTIGLQIELAKSHLNNNHPLKAIELCKELLNFEQIINNQIYNKTVSDLISQANALIEGESALK